MKIIHYLSIAVSLALVSCTSIEDVTWPKLDDTDNNNNNNNIAKVQLTRVDLDSVYTSASGFSKVINGRICFFDKYLSKLFIYSIDGKIISSKLGFGNGPQETVIRNAATFCSSANGKIAILGSNTDYQIISEEGIAEPYETLTYLPDKKGKSDNFYNYSYAWNNMQSIYNNGFIYISMDCEHPSFNYFETTDKILKQKKHIGVIDVDTREVNMLSCGYPEIYHDNPYKYSSVNLINFDLYSNERFIINFEATPEIYVCNVKGTPKSVFGAKGKQIDQDYIKVKSYDMFDGYFENRKNKGRYSFLKYIDEDNLIFRSYIKGSQYDDDGLQVYKNEKIVGDISVPKGFYVIGKVGEAYISNIYFDESGGYFYKFNL